MGIEPLALCQGVKLSAVKAAMGGEADVLDAKSRGSAV